MLRYTYQVGDLFRSFCDEDDASFLTAAQVQEYLDQGYQQFRNTVYEIDPEAFTTYADINVTSSPYDLDVGNFTGASATRRMVKIVRLTQVYPSGEVALVAASSLAELEQGADFYVYSHYIYFRSSLTGTFRLWYVPYSAVDWSKLTSATTEYIDDYITYHDLIALYAYRYYAIRDGAVNPILEMQLKERLNSLKAFVNQGRVLPATDHVTCVNLEW